MTRRDHKVWEDIQGTGPFCFLVWYCLQSMFTFWGLCTHDLQFSYVCATPQCKLKKKKSSRHFSCRDETENQCLRRDNRGNNLCYSSLEQCCSRLNSFWKEAIAFRFGLQLPMENLAYSGCPVTIHWLITLESLSLFLLLRPNKQKQPSIWLLLNDTPLQQDLPFVLPVPCHYWHLRWYSSGKAGPVMTLNFQRDHVPKF